MNHFDLQTRGITHGGKILMNAIFELARQCAPLSLMIAVFSGVNGWAQTQQAQEKPEALPDMPAKIYDKIAPVMVKIASTNGNQEGSGTVIGINSQGRAVILTACHVVASNGDEPDQNIPLEFHPAFYVRIGSEAKARRATLMVKRVESTQEQALKDNLKRGVVPESYVACFDRADDLALLITRDAVPHLNPIPYNHSDGVKPGQKVAAFGFPGRDKLTQTVGRITGKDNPDDKYLVFDAEIRPGNSGGPLIDDAGRMIGMAVFKKDIHAGEGYALPMNVVLSKVEPWLQKLALPEVWQRQKYESFWKQTYQDPKILAPGLAFLGVGGYLLFKPPPQGEAIFGSPPGPPIAE